MTAGFKSADARRQYMTAYDEVRALSPRPDIVHDVQTNAGTVRVYQHGPDGDVPVVLIHGFFLTSAMWWDQVAGLTDDFTVYALDMLGQPGASIQSKAMFTPAACARNIEAVLEALSLRDVNLVGHSYGGWLATHTAARLPGRLATLTLIDPACTVTRLYSKFWRSFGIWLSRPRSLGARRAAAWVLGDPTAGSSIDTLAELFVEGFATFGPPARTAALHFPNDRLLRAVELPVQVLLAGNTIHDSHKALQRMRTVVPAWRYELWPDASHALSAEVPDEVNASIRRFALEHRGGI
ncbi:alpha/beta fold hydrolase [Mycobacterium sp. NPDC051804]|uniref:alpha/beta fold hydrolase n=1 Tax=Mycobacterium sp. NPDC051804 TaxID=3364295 RepID=UPI00379C4F65